MKECSPPWTLKVRVISDSTEELVKDILHQYRAGQGQDDVATRKAFALNRRMFEKRLEEDKKYREAFLKYKSLERDAWYLRYGDYLTISLTDLRSKAKAAHKPAEEEERGDAPNVHLKAVVRDPALY